MEQMFRGISENGDFELGQAECGWNLGGWWNGMRAWVLLSKTECHSVRMRRVGREICSKIEHRRSLPEE
jgi:hypothetical protein